MDRETQPKNPQPGGTPFQLIDHEKRQVAIFAHGHAVLLTFEEYDALHGGFDHAVAVQSLRNSEKDF